MVYHEKHDVWLCGTLDAISLEKNRIVEIKSGLKRSIITSKDTIDQVCYYMYLAELYHGTKFRPVGLYVQTKRNKEGEIVRTRNKKFYNLAVYCANYRLRTEYRIKSFLDGVERYEYDI